MPDDKTNTHLLLNASLNVFLKTSSSIMGAVIEVINKVKIGELRNKPLTFSSLVAIAPPKIIEIMALEKTIIDNPINQYLIPISTKDKGLFLKFLKSLIKVSRYKIQSKKHTTELPIKEIKESLNGVPGLILKNKIGISLNILENKNKSTISTSFI